MSVAWDDEDEEPVLRVTDELGRTLSSEEIDLVVSQTLHEMRRELQKIVRATAQAVIRRARGRVD